MPVHLLRVCRQIYHEAALKPYTEPTFGFIIAIVGPGGMNSFLTHLVPEQARAIGHLHLTCRREFRLSKLAVSLFRGVKHVEVEVDTPNDLAVFKQRGGVEWLKNADLKSVRFNVSIRGGAVLAEERRDATMEWITREEEEVMDK
jgi:hypothetical protein